MDYTLFTLKELYRRYSDIVFRHCYVEVGSRAKALQMTEQIFFASWKHLSTDRGELDPETILYQAMCDALQEVEEARERQRGMTIIKTYHPRCV